MLKTEYKNEWPDLKKIRAITMEPERFVSGFTMISLKRSASRVILSLMAAPYLVYGITITIPAYG
jgi:hypothetical protein